MGCSRSELYAPGASGIGGPTNGPPDPSFADRPRAVRVATSGNDAITAVGSDWHGNVYFVAVRGGASDFTLTVIGRDGSKRDEHCPESDATSQTMVAKLSPNGDCVWAHYFSGDLSSPPDVRMAVSPEGVVIVSTSSWWQTMSWEALGDGGQPLWTNTYVGPFARPNPKGGFILFGYDATASGQVTSIDAAGDELGPRASGPRSSAATLTGFAADDSGRALVAAEVSGVWSPTGDANADVDTHGKTLSLVSVYSAGTEATVDAREETAMSTDPAPRSRLGRGGRQRLDVRRRLRRGFRSSGARRARERDRRARDLGRRQEVSPYGMVAHPDGTVTVGILDDDPPDVTRVRTFDSSLLPVSSDSISPTAQGRVVLDSITPIPNNGTLVGGFFDVGAGDGSFSIDALGGDDGLLVWVD